MLEIQRKTRVVNGVNPDQLPLDELMEAEEPVIFRKMAVSWPLVQQGLLSPAAAMDYLQAFYSGKPLVTYMGQPEIKGRFFYKRDLSGLNFSTEWMYLESVFERILQNFGKDLPPSYYIGSTSIDGYFPELRRENDLIASSEPLARHAPLASIWMGNRTVASAHFDMSNNIACCAVGRRRFTLFPPEQIENLYPGPLEPTPGGQIVSMVDFDNPDYEQFPRFKKALAAAQVAEMEPGDVLFYPSLWWHQVEAIDDFNVLINYWWNPVPGYLDTPMNTLMHGLLSLRGRPDQEKRAWKALFDYYLFDSAEKSVEHLPQHTRGYLAPLDKVGARRLRALLLKRLNR